MFSALKELTRIVFAGKKNLLMEVKEEWASGFFRDVSRRQAYNAPTAGTVISEHECPVLQSLSLTPEASRRSPVCYHVHLMVMENARANGCLVGLPSSYNPGTPPRAPASPSATGNPRSAASFTPRAENRMETIFQQMDKLS